MTQDKAPEWATEQAASINLVLPYLHVQQEIALALSQAYERGQVDMRERCLEAAWPYKHHDTGYDIFEGIRSLPIEKDRAGEDGE